MMLPLCLATLFVALGAQAQPSFTNIGLPPSAFATGLAPQKLAGLAVEELQVRRHACICVQM